MLKVIGSEPRWLLPPNTHPSPSLGASPPASLGRGRLGPLCPLTLLFASGGSGTLGGGSTSRGWRRCRTTWGTNSLASWSLRRVLFCRRRRRSTPTSSFCKRPMLGSAILPLYRGMLATLVNFAFRGSLLCHPWLCFHCLFYFLILVSWKNSE